MLAVCEEEVPTPWHGISSITRTCQATESCTLIHTYAWGPCYTYLSPCVCKQSLVFVNKAAWPTCLTPRIHTQQVSAHSPSLPTCHCLPTPGHQSWRPTQQQPPHGIPTACRLCFLSKQVLRFNIFLVHTQPPVCIVTALSFSNITLPTPILHLFLHTVSFAPVPYSTTHVETPPSCAVINFDISPLVTPAPHSVQSTAIYSAIKQCCKLLIRGIWHWVHYVLCSNNNCYRGDFCQQESSFIECCL